MLATSGTRAQALAHTLTRATLLLLWRRWLQGVPNTCHKQNDNINGTSSDNNNSDNNRSTSNDNDNNNDNNAMTTKMTTITATITATTTVQQAKAICPGTPGKPQHMHRTEANHAPTQRACPNNSGPICPATVRNF